MSILKCVALTKNYGAKTALNNLELELESGKLYGLIGRNGAGKTTLLSVMSNQKPITSGCVMLDGERIWENPEAIKHIFFSREPTATSGLGRYTVKKYLDIAASLLPFWDKEAATRLLDFFSVDPSLRISALSQGMVSAVTIIVAIASKAEFTFMDEPVAGLDIITRNQFYKLLLDEYAQSGRTFVISSHIIDEAADILEETIILDRGQVLIKENTQDLIERCFLVSGLAQQVELATAGLECRNPEHLGRSKSVTVLLQPGQTIDRRYDVTVQPMSLQKIFVSLCSQEGS